MRYSSGARYSRAKPVGSFRVKQVGGPAVASHDKTLAEARKSAVYWTSAVGSPMEIQERFPSGEWVPVEVVRPRGQKKDNFIGQPLASSRSNSHLDKLKIGDAVQFRWEPNTGGVIRRFAGGHAEVATSRGDRSVPTSALVRVRKEHEARVKHSVSHLTKRAIPGVTKWSTTAGGTGAAEGKYGYTFTVPEGTYRIWPYTTKYGRHAGYLLKFSAEGGRGFPRGSHSGLWHDLGSHRSPQKAASAAATHYAKGFE